MIFLLLTNFLLISTTVKHDNDFHLTKSIKRQDNRATAFVNQYRQIPKQTPKIPKTSENLLDELPEVVEFPENSIYVSGADLEFDNKWNGDGIKWTNSQGANATYSFSGTRFWVVCQLKSDNGKIKIIIDDSETFSVNTYSDTEMEGCVFTSNILHNKEHEVTFVCEEEGKTIQINALYYSELPEIIENVPGEAAECSHEKIQYSQTGWQDNNQGVPYSVEKGATASFTFTGSRIWAICKINVYHGSMEIIIDETYKYYVNTHTDGETIENELVFTSELLEFTEHSIKFVSLDESAIQIQALKYLKYPEGEEIQHIQVLDFTPETEGVWTTGENGEFWTETKNSKISYTFVGNKFWLYGKKAPDHGILRIDIDDQEIAQIDCHSYDQDDEALLYSTEKNLTYQKHTISCSYIGNSQGNSGVDLRFFYYNQPTGPVSEEVPELGDIPSNAIKIPSSEFKYSDNWEYSGDNIYTTNKGSYATYEFTGTRVWIECKVAYNHGKMEIILDNRQSYVVNTQSQNQDDYHHIFTSNILENTDHTIRFTNIDNEGYAIQLSNLYYIKDSYKLPTLVEVSKNSVEVPQQELSFSDEGWSEYGGYKYSNKIGASMSYSFSGSQIWVVGKIASNHGKMEIILDGKNYIVDTKTQDDENLDKLLFSSEVLEETEHQIKMISLDTDPIEVHKLHYSSSLSSLSEEEEEITTTIESTTEESIYDDLPEIIEPIPENAAKSSYSDFVYSENGWYSNDIPYSYEKDAWETFSFTGTRIWAICKVHKDHGPMEIIIDENQKYYVNTYAEYDNQNDNKIVFTSDILDFSEHTIKFISLSDKAIQIQAVYFLNDPQEENIQYVPINKFNFANQGDWGRNEDTSGYYSWIKNSPISYTYEGTNFWLYGKKALNHGVIQIIIDGDETKPIEIDCHSEKRDPYALLYSSTSFSPHLIYQKHTVSIFFLKNDRNDREGIEINRFYYQQPPNQTIPEELPPTVDIPDHGNKVIVNEIQFNGDWRGDDEKYTTEVGASAEYSFKGTRFWIRGKIAPNHGRMRIEVDEDKYYIVNTKQNITNYDYLLFSSYELTDSEHSIKIICLDEPIEIKYFYYSNCPLAENITYVYIEQFEFAKQGDWRRNEDTSGYYSWIKNSPISYTYEGTNFWLYGKKALNHGVIQIIIDGDETKPIEIDCHSEKRDLYALLYSTATTESTNLENKLHTVSISFLKNNIGTEGIEINRFYYQNPQEIPTDENPPSVKIPEYANRIHSSKFTLHGSWAESGNTGGQYTKKPGDWAEYSFVGTQFWIKGKIGNDHGKMQIILDGKRKYIVDNYNEEINQDFLMFSSLKLENTNHTIKIINVNKVTEITYLYYLDSPEGENIRFVKIDEFQEDYGTEWKTNTESTGKYTSQIDSQISCTYGGTQFWIYGKKGPKHGIIHVILDGDEKNKLEINCSSQTEQYYALLYKPLENITYKKHNVSILYPNIPENNGKSIEINKFFYYRPDEPMPDELPPLTEIHQFAYKVTIDRLSYNGVWRGDDEKYTTEVGASAEYSFKGTRFWIRGKIAPNHGRMRIEVDEDKYYIVNTKQNITNYDYLLFSSYELTDSEHSIKIICLDEPIEIKYIFFVSSSPKGDNIKYANAIGFKYEDSAQWSNSNNVFEGLWTTTKNSKALFTFYGTEFWLYGKIAPNHGIIQLNIDNEHSPTVNCHSEKEDSNILLYHSSGLNPSFDYHTIEISYIDNSVGNEGIQINRLYYQQPNNTNIELPGEIVSSPIHANAISAHKFTMDTYWGNGNSGGKYSENNGASMTFKFTGYQFWIQGKVAPHHGKMQLIVDNSVSYIIDTQNEQSEDQHLMFSSSKIENKENTVTIINVDAVVEITYLLYLNTPEIKNLQYVNVQDFQLENGNWKDLDESQGKFTSEKGSKITYSFQGSSFWLYGRKAPSYGIISIVVDDNEEDSKTINCYSETTDYYALLMNPYHLLYGNHTISISYPDIEENNDKTGVEINRLYHYKPEGPTPEDQVPPTVVIPENAISIHSSTFERDADWDISGNTGGIYSGQLGATAIAKFTGCQFWIKGKVAPHHGNMQIIIDDEITYIVNTRLETNNDYLMFSSNILQNKEHTIKFIQIDYVIEIVTLHFISIPEPDISTDSTEEVSTMIQPTEDKPTPEKPTPIEPTEDKSKPEEPTPEKPTTIPPTPEKPINPSDVIPSNATLIEFDQMKNKDWSIKDGKASTGIAGSFLEFGFNGSQLFIVGYKNKGTGILKVIIDGKYENIDTNSVNQVDTTLLYPTTLNKVNLLNIEITEGAHRVKLEHSGPNGNLIQLHSVYILGEESGFNISSVTDSTNDNSETNGENDSKLQPGAIVGIVIAALIVVLVAVIFAYFFIHIKRRNVSHAQTSAEMTVETDNFYSGDLTDKYQSNSQSQENRFYNSSDSNHSVEDILNYNFEEGE